MKTINIMFLGGAKRVSLAEHFIKAGIQLGVKVNIYSYELSTYCPIASIGKVIIGKKWNDPDLLKDLMRIIQEYSINIILPSVDPAIGCAAKLNVALGGKVFIPVSKEEICNFMFDKKLAENWFINNNVPIPQCYNHNDTFCFPVIIKPRKGSASQGIKVIEDIEDWAGVANPDSYVIQQYIANKTEYTVDCYIAQNGDIISIVPRERLAVSGGEVMNSITLHDEVMENIASDILRKGDFRGPANVQFIKDNENGKIYVMEVNPRFGGGVITSIEAGADTPKFVLQEYLGQAIQPCNNWKEKTLMTRYFKEVIFYADNH